MPPLTMLKKWGWLFALLGVFAVAAWDWYGEPARPSGIAAMTAPITANDISQGRLNAVPPAPGGRWRIRQEFVAGHDGLSAIELILARNGEPDPEEDGRLTLTLFDEHGQAITEQALLTRHFHHNDTYTFAFPTQFNAAGRRYALELSGNQTNRLTVWGYDLDVYDNGQMTLMAATDEPAPDTAVQDLRFITRYQLTWRAAVMVLARQLWHDGAIILLALLFLLLPGALLQRLRPLPWRQWDRLAQMGTALALGTATWPLVWYAFSLVGGRVTGWLLWAWVLGGWLLVIVGGRRRLIRYFRSSSRRPTPSGHHLLLLLILLSGLGVRLLAVRDLAAPPWVDAGRHALITAVMVENGRTITDYTPFLPVVRFPYHFGFHTLSASLTLMSGWELPRLLLVFGQLLNALVPLTVYTAVWLMVRRRGAALLAAFLVAVPFFFPAYYATWGRFTQLTAMLVMPVLLAFTWLLVRGGRRWQRGWVVVALLAAGVFLIHFRVFIFYGPFVAVLWLVSGGRHGRWLVLAGIAGGLLVLPRVFYLNAITDPLKTLAHNLPNYNEFPLAYYRAGWDRFFIWLAVTLSLPVLLGSGILMPATLMKRDLKVFPFPTLTSAYGRWAMFPLVLIAWVGLLFLLLAGEYLGLPSTSLVNLNSMYIILFLPLAMCLGVLLDQGWRWWRRRHWLGVLLGYVAAGGCLTAVTLFGIQQQINILNPETILVRPADIPAYTWLQTNLPPEAIVVVNAWKWLGSTWAGADGGAWIVPLTGRASSTPPADYIYSHTLYQQVNAFNEAATAVTDWSAPDTADWLHQQGYTHIFVGARGGFLDPAALARNPNLQMLYAQDGVFIFAIGDE